MIKQGDYVCKLLDISTDKKSIMPNEIYYLILDIIDSTLEVYEMQGRPLPFESVYDYNDIVLDGYTMQMIKNCTTSTITQYYTNNDCLTGMNTGIEFAWNGKTYIKQNNYYYNGKEFVKYPNMVFMK